MVRFGFGYTQREQDARDCITVQSHSNANPKASIHALGTDLHNAELKDREWNGKSTVRQDYRAYMLAVAAYLGIVLFGYDTGLGGGVLKLPGFIHDYHITGSTVHIANLSANIVSILQAGAFFGALASAPFNNWLGRKWSLMLGCWIFIVGGVLQTAGVTLSTLYPGRFLAGVGVGLLSAVCPVYVAEMAPADVRGRITGLFQVLVVIGVALSYWINYGVSFMKSSSAQWRIPVGFQLAPCVLMVIILPFIKESPRWLASKHRNADALKNLAWVRNRSEDSVIVQLELAEIVAACEADEEAMRGVSPWKEITKRGNPQRFFIAVVFFVLQQWSGQNSINYYAPTIFNSIGITGTSASLLASGVYGAVKVVATTAFILFGVERAGRKKYLFFGACGMSLFLWLIFAVFYTHVPNPKATSPSGASIGMAVLIYLFVIPYCFSWGPMVWIVCAELFNTRARAYGLAAASASQWLNNFAVTRATPLMVVAMPKGTIFCFFASINIINACWSLWIPETKGLTLEQMDIVFGSVTREEREAEIRGSAQQMHIGDSSSGYGSGGSISEGGDMEKHEKELHIERAPGSNV